MSEPYIDRTNIIARFKERKYGRNIMLFGRDCDADANSRSNIRAMHDGDLLIQGDMLVSLFGQKTPEAEPAGMRFGLYLLHPRHRYGHHRAPYSHDRTPSQPPVHPDECVLPLVL